MINKNYYHLLLGLVLYLSQAYASDVFPDSSKDTSAVFLAYNPSQTDELVVTTYKLIKKINSKIKLYLLMTKQNREDFKMYNSYCQQRTYDPDNIYFYICQMQKVLDDKQIVQVIVLNQHHNIIYPQDYFQFYLKGKKPTLFPIVNEFEVGIYKDRDNKPLPVDISVQQELVQQLEVPLTSIKLQKTKGTNLTMGGNIESLPGNIVVIGEDGQEMPPDDELKAMLKKYRPDLSEESNVSPSVTSVIADVHLAKRTQDAQEELVKSMGINLLKLKTKYMPVQHVDEVFSVVRSNAQCGFSILVPSPKIALELLQKQVEEDAHGSCIATPLERRADFGNDKAVIREHVSNGCLGFRGAKAKDYLKDDKFIQLNNELQSDLDQNRTKISLALQRICKQVDFVELPYLIRTNISENNEYNEGVFPNPVNALIITPAKQNSIYVNNPTFFPAFDSEIQKSLVDRGVSIEKVWDSIFFEGLGGVHCGSNSLQRAID